jgi:hypothetical protein
MTVVEALAAIEAERRRQADLHGAEWDLRNSPNDWIAIASHYLAESVRRGNNLPTADEYKESLIKAAAVIVAALEHVSVITSKGGFRE